jgi:4'-phosphopantetheinyl transferase
VSQVRATEGIVDVWHADLTAAQNRFDDLLCAQEHERARQMLSERKRQLWIGSRAVLRALLGRYLDRDPRELRFTLGPHGKPALHQEAAEGADPPDLRFNLSHSGDLVLVAVTAGREVGVDIEHARERYTASFLRAWVAREAAVKCHGTGLGAPHADAFAAGLWSTGLDAGDGAVAAVAVQGGEECQLRCWQVPALSST